MRPMDLPLRGPSRGNDSHRYIKMKGGPSTTASAAHRPFGRSMATGGVLAVFKMGLSDLAFDLPKETVAFHAGVSHWPLILGCGIGSAGEGRPPDGVASTPWVASSEKPASARRGRVDRQTA